MTAAEFARLTARASSLAQRHLYCSRDSLQAFRNPDSQEPCEYDLAMDVTGYPETLAHRAGS
jgi:hypothetical protein